MIPAPSRQDNTDFEPSTLMSRHFGTEMSHPYSTLSELLPHRIHEQKKMVVFGNDICGVCYTAMAKGTSQWVTMIASTPGTPGAVLAGPGAMAALPARTSPATPEPGRKS